VGTQPGTFRLILSADFFFKKRPFYFPAEVGWVYASWLGFLIFRLFIFVFNVRQSVVAEAVAVAQRAGVVLDKPPLNDDTLTERKAAEEGVPSGLSTTEGNVWEV
jgi:hypothetical protein